MRKYSQKELLSEGFFDFIKKTKKAMSAIDPKATANLTRPFEQVRDVYRSFKSDPGSKKGSNLEYISELEDRDMQQFLQKNQKIVDKIINSEQNLYNRKVDPTKIKMVNLRDPSGKTLQGIIIVSKNINRSKSSPRRYLYDKSGNFIKNL